MDFFLRRPLGTVRRRMTVARPFTLAAVLLSLISGVAVGARVSRTMEEGIVPAVYGSFPVPHLPETDLDRASRGLATAEFDQPLEEGGLPEEGSGPQLPGAYAPIAAEHTGQLIAVAEVYEPVEDIEAQFIQGQWQTCLIASIFAAAVILALFWIVKNRSTIGRRQALTQRISELSTLLHQNKALRDRIERGARLVAEDRERFLNQIGSELHDGPAQLVGLAVLRLDEIKSVSPDQTDAIREILSDALDEIRNICAGLFLPGTQDRTLKEALRCTIHDHERRTRTKVAFEFAGDGSVRPPRYVILCLCRFVQEGLTNAFLHAGGKDQLVSAWLDGAAVCVEVSDHGPGIRHDQMRTDHTPLGLIGLRGRVESIGGTMLVSCPPEGGTRLTARLPMIEET